MSVPRMPVEDMKQNGIKGFFINDWRVSPSEGLLILGDEEVKIEPKAMEVLVYFASRPNEVITREELERDVWRGALVGYDAVTNTVIKLRKALQDDARQPRYISTIPKKGYKLVASVTYPADAESRETPASVPSEKPGGQPTNASPSILKPGVVLAVLLILVVFGWVGYWISTQFPTSTTVEPSFQADREQTNQNPKTEIPSIAVLPFENLSDDPNQEYLAEGITDDLITDLSKLSNLVVIATDKASAYQGKQIKVEAIGLDLKVNYVLKGSIRKVGDAIRLNAQLVDSNSGFNVWAERYDRKLTEVFAIQDEVTSNIVKALSVKVTNQETNLLRKRATDNLKAYDLFQEGQKIALARTKEAHDRARDIYEKVIELDPNYGRAYGAMAITLAYDYQRGWTEAPNETLDRALVLAKKAVALDDSTPQTYWALSLVHLLSKDYENAKKTATQAITISPNYADGYGLLGLIQMNLGQPEEAIDLTKKGMRLNPFYTWQYLFVLGGSHFMLGNYKEAITELEEAQRRNTTIVQTKLFLAACYVESGMQEQAEWLVDELQILDPDETIANIGKTTPIAREEYKHAFLAALKKAGMPE